MDMELLILYAILAIASVWDTWKFRIPNALLALGVIVGFSLSFVDGGWGAVGDTSLRFVQATLLLFLFWCLFELFRAPLFGAGDIKLLIMISCFLPLYSVVELFFFAIILSSIFFLFLISPNALKRMFDQFMYFVMYFIPSKEKGKLKRIPFAVPILFAAVLQMHVFPLI